MPKLTFKAGRLKEYHGDGLHLVDGDTTPNLDEKVCERLMTDFPDMFFPAGENTSDTGKGAKTPENLTLNFKRMTVPSLLAFVDERGLEIDGVDEMKKDDLVAAITEAQVAAEPKKTET